MVLENIEECYKCVTERLFHVAV